MPAKERPMLYSTDMVVSILEDRKTNTRRKNGLDVVNEDPGAWKDWGQGFASGSLIWKFKGKFNGAIEEITCPWNVGDLLWVRETVFDVEPYRSYPLFQNCERYLYKADQPFIGDHKFKPSFHMPKVAARIWLQITEIGIERLQSISASDAIREGIRSKTERKKSGLCTFYKDYCNENDWYWSAKASFMSLWQKINGRESWNANPWVWVISFKVLSKTGKPSPEKISGFQSKTLLGERLKSSPSGIMQEQVEEAHLLPGNGDGKEVDNA